MLLAENFKFILVVMKRLVEKVVEKNSFAGVRKVAVVALWVALAWSFYSCGKSSEYCDCKDDMYFYYYFDEKIRFDHHFLNNWLFVGFYQHTTDVEMINFLNKTGFFKTINASDIIYNPNENGEYYRFMFAYNKIPKNCNQLKEIIRILENAPIVSHVSLTFEGKTYIDTPSEPQKGYQRVMAFHATFNVRVKDASDLSDLHTVAQETNTTILWQLQNNWFTLGADKTSKGNAFQMANFFYETGRFVDAHPNFFVTDLKINN